MCTRIAAAAALAASVGTAAGQATVTIGDGQVLTEQDLLAGSFGGSSFVLSPTTTFELLIGSRIGGPDFQPAEPTFIDFGGSTIEGLGGRFGNVNYGGAYENATINLRLGALSQRAFLGRGVVVNMTGGVLGQGITMTDGAELHVADGRVSFGLSIEDGAMSVSGGEVGRLALNSSTLVMTGGEIDEVFGGNGSSLWIEDGRSFLVGAGTDSTAEIRSSSINEVRAGGTGVLEVFSGTIGRGVASSGGTVIMRGGVSTSEGGWRTFQNGTIHIAGGRIGDRARIEPDGTLRLSGGRIGRFIRVASSASVELVGDEIQIAGRPADVDPETGLIQIVQDGRVLNNGILTATLSDGTVVIFPRTVGDGLGNRIFVERVPLDPAVTEPMTSDSGPVGLRGLRSGQTLILRGDASLPYGFGVVGASLMFEGGSAGDHLEVVDSMVIVDAGTIGEQFWAHEGTSVAMNGGMIGRYLTIYGGAELMMTGGFLAGAELSGVDEFGPDIGLVFKRAYAEISGGHIQEFFVGGNAAVQISGGRFDQPKAEAGSVFGGFSATRGGEVHLFVSQLLIDGEVVPLAPHVSTEILQRSGSELEAVLRDGSVFELQLGGINQGSRNFVPDDALLTATRGPINPLDFDLNNIVDISDLFAFIMAFTMSPADARTDFDGNGVVNISDLFAYITAFTASP